jgi:hypothetical protein
MNESKTENETPPREEEYKTPQQYFVQFKENIQKKVVELSFQQEKDKIQELLEYVYEYSSYPFELPSPASNTTHPSTKPHTPKKRVKPPVTQENRCRAKLSNGGQCSRQRLKEGQLCGSHHKVQPYGLVTVCSTTFSKNNKEQELNSHEVFAVEIQGLVYYVDHVGNVFHTEDVMNDVPNPAIIAQYVKTPTGYSIPSLALM